MAVSEEVVSLGCLTLVCPLLEGTQKHSAAETSPISHALTHSEYISVITEK